jgi:hypothetical protein
MIKNSHCYKVITLSIIATLSIIETFYIKPNIIAFICTSKGLSSYITNNLLVIIRNALSICDVTLYIPIRIMNRE